MEKFLIQRIISSNFVSILPIHIHIYYYKLNPYLGLRLEKNLYSQNDYSLNINNKIRKVVYAITIKSLSLSFSDKIS